MSTSKNDLQAEAVQWLVRLDAGTADPRAFEAWRQANPLHAVAYVHAQAAWEAMSAASATAQAPASPAAPAPAASTSHFDRRTLLRAASIAVPTLAIGGGALIFSAQTPAYASTAVGEQRRFAAGPDLTIELNTDSRIGWKQAGSSCQLWLERGEASLVLEGGPTRGAVLHCVGRELMLAPGAYNARLLDTGPDLVVIEGRAWLPGTASDAVAQPGERIHFTGAKSSIGPAPASALEAAAAWRRGEIVFNGQPLSEALGEYNRYLDHKLAVTDSALGALRVGGRFETARPQAFVAAIETAFGLEAVRQDDLVLLRRKKPDTQ